MENEQSIANEATEAGAEVVENQEVEQQEGATAEGVFDAEQEVKLDKLIKTEEQRELDRLRRGLERQRARAAQWRAKAELVEQQRLQSQEKPVNYQSDGDDSQPLSLTKAELAKFVEERAREIAPTIAEQTATEGQLKKAAESLRESLGEDEFEELTDELASVFGGPQQIALLQTEKPAEVIRHLADNPKEAEALAKLSDYQFGRAVAKLELKLAQAPTSAPKPSKAPKPLEEPQGRRAGAPSSEPQDSDSIDVWLKKERARMKSKGITGYA
jgi:hypothetical protein